jgi:hypothetical protein
VEEVDAVLAPLDREVVARDVHVAQAERVVRGAPDPDQLAVEEDLERGFALHLDA